MRNLYKITYQHNLGEVIYIAEIKNLPDMKKIFDLRNHEFIDVPEDDIVIEVKITETLKCSGQLLPLTDKKFEVLHSQVGKIELYTGY